jgi:murein DD-endopeptidase MepM/ murein hydrolase activator NlpD
MKPIEAVTIFLLIFFSVAGCTAGDPLGDGQAPREQDAAPLVSNPRALQGQLTTPPSSKRPLTSIVPCTWEYRFPLQPGSAASYQQGHHDYPASDIFAPVGTTFVAVTSGTVDEVSRRDRWDPFTDSPATRGGLFVSLIGDDGVRYYGSHLSSVAESVRRGHWLRAGEILGRVGATGNARGTSPHLHFGISHPTGEGDWRVRRGEVDPFPYLEAWRRGTDTTPILHQASQVDNQRCNGRGNHEGE